MTASAPERGCGTCAPAVVPNSRRPGYKCWQMMLNRCRNRRCAKWHHYGGRGITVCERWQGARGFENFVADMGERPSPKHEIDRIDVNGNYEPGNCRWATRKEQMRNVRSNLVIAFRGESLTLIEWAERLGMPYTMLHQRFYTLGWNAEKAFTTPAHANSRPRSLDGIRRRVP